MARIALMVGIGAAAALTGGLGLLPSALGATLANGGAAAAIQAGMLGLTVGSTLGSALFPKHLPNQYGPRLNDLLTSTSTPGSPIPILYGKHRFAGQIIWSPGGLIESSTTSSLQSKDGGVTTTTYEYFCSLAIAFCEGPADILSIWADGKQLWVSGSTPDQGSIQPYNSALTYSTGDVVSWQQNGKTLYYQAVRNVPVGQSPGLIFIFGNQVWALYTGPFGQTGTYTKVTSITPYTGAATQNPDPTILASNNDTSLSNANTPAFRGLCYVVVADLLLKDFGNRVPNFTALVQSQNPKTLDAVLADLATRSNVDSEDQNFAGAAGITLNGYLVSQPTDARTAISQLAQAYFFDVFESDFQLKAKLRNSTTPAVLTIPEADLGIITDNSSLDETITQNQELPIQVEVSYLDPSLLWQPNKQMKNRHARGVATRNKAIIELPIVLYSTEAVQIAEQYLFLSWLERKPIHTNLWNAKYMILDPTDVFQFVYQGTTYQARLTRNSIGQNFVTEIQAVSHDSVAYQSTTIGGGSGGVVVPGSGTAAQTIWWLLDIPYLQDSDAENSLTGYYWAVSSPSIPYSGGVLLTSFDNVNFITVGGSNIQTPYGIAQNALSDPAGSLWSWDDVNTIVVQVAIGTPSSAADEDVLNGANVIAVLRADGQAELIQFANAELTGIATDGSNQGIYTLSRLLRGRRNTEYAAFGHGANETVLFINNAIQRNAGQALNFIGRTVHDKGVTFGTDPSAVSSQIFVSKGNDLLPASPVHVTGSRDISNNLTIGWTRRTRFGGTLTLSSTSPPLNEASEAYEIDVYSGVTVVRTISWVSGTYAVNGLPESAYSAAQQVADGLVPGNPVHVKIYQISAQVGRGHAADATI